MDICRVKLSILSMGIIWHFESWIPAFAGMTVARGCHTREGGYPFCHFMTDVSIYCDVLSLMDAELLKQYLSGSVGSVEITQGFLLAAGILMEISISMVLLSRVLKYRANRRANIIAGTITTVVQIATLFVGSPPTMYYIFFSIIEIASTALIVWFAWNWRNVVIITNN